MQTNSTRLIVFISAVMVLMVACYLPGLTVEQPVATQAPVDANLIYTAAAQTLSAQLTINAPPVIEPSMTAASPPEQVPESILPTNTPILYTPTASATSTLIFTATSQNPVITADINTNCRNGPGPQYRVVGYFLTGMSSYVYGKYGPSTNIWWYIDNPDKPGSYCWVWGGSTTVTGNTGSIPVFTPPPPPPTETLTGAAFTASYDSSHKCSGDWYAIFVVKNISGVVFESMSIKTKRVDTDAIISNASTNNPFLSSSSSCPSGADQLDPGKKAYVASLIEGAPSGKEAKTTIYLCTKENLDGKCVYVTVKYTFP